MNQIAKELHSEQISQDTCSKKFNVECVTILPTISMYLSTKCVYYKLEK